VDPYIIYHITEDSKSLCNLTNSQPILISLPNGVRIMAAKHDMEKVSSKFILHDLLHVLEFS